MIDFSRNWQKIRCKDRLLHVLNYRLLLGFNADFFISRLLFILILFFETLHNTSYAKLKGQYPRSI